MKRMIALDEWNLKILEEFEEGMRGHFTVSWEYGCADVGLCEGNDV